MTEATFDEARRFLSTEDLEAGQVDWLLHGTFHLSTRTLIGEVALPEFEPPSPPQKQGDSSFVTIWQPAVGKPVPHRDEWRLERKLGDGHYGEVWLAQREQGHDRRVIKFCSDPAKLKTLQEELKVLQLIKALLPNRPDVARLLDWQITQEPAFLEFEYSAGTVLTDWCLERGGGKDVPLKDRVEIAARTALAIDAAHSLGILHKDIRPSHVLVMQRASNEAPQVQVFDFGFGSIFDSELVKERLEEHATPFDFVAETGALEYSGPRGCPRYEAPELRDAPDAEPTVESDVYSMGVLLYQLVVGDIERGLHSGWESEVHDDLLRADIKKCLSRDRTRRFSSLGELAHRLLALPDRRRRLVAERRASFARSALALIDELENKKRDRSLMQSMWLLTVLTATTGALAVLKLGSLFEAHQLAQIEMARTSHEEQARPVAKRLKAYMEQTETSVKNVADGLHAASFPSMPLIEALEREAQETGDNTTEEMGGEFEKALSRRSTMRTGASPRSPTARRSSLGRSPPRTALSWRGFRTHPASSVKTSKNVTGSAALKAT